MRRQQAHAPAGIDAQHAAAEALDQRLGEAADAAAVIEQDRVGTGCQLAAEMRRQPRRLGRPALIGGGAVGVRMMRRASSIVLTSKISGRWA